MVKRVDLRAELSVGRHALSVGRVPQVAEWISGVPRRVPSLIELMWDDDPGVANRAADVLERITRRPSPALQRAVTDHKEALLGLLAEAEEKKLRWNLAFTVPRLTLTIPECRRAATALHGYLDDRSSIVKTAALHGLADLTRHDPESLPEVVDLLRVAGRSGTPAMRARSRILLKRLETPAGKGPHRTSLHMFD